MFRSIATLGLLLSLAVANAALGGVYVAPSGGYDLFYDADSGNRPDQMAPAWSSGYQTTNPAGVRYSAVQTDALTGENTLFMDQNDAAITGASYLLTTPPGSGTASDQTTVDFRFRLLDAAQGNSTGQLTVNVNRPSPTAGKRQMYYTKLSEGGVNYYDGGTNRTTAAAIGTGWHDARYVLDMVAGTGTFYLDRNPDALFTHQRYESTTASHYNHIQIGDGSGSIWGQAQLSYVGWTNSELAPVILGSLHEGDKRPDTREGFTVVQGGTGITTQGGVENGTEYWEITDPGGAYRRYVDTLDTAELDNGGGWMATSKVRVLNASTNRYAIYMLVADSQDRWSLTLSEDAAWYQSSAGYTKLLDMDTTDAYHTYQLLHNPAGDSGNGSTTVLIDGTFVALLTRGDVANNPAATDFSWGTFNTGSNSQARWNLAQFQVVPEPSTFLLLGIGLTALPAFGRRRKRNG